jgi:pSer/pThr/pTyr-binding forkhead associated (FHA) protein
MNPKAYLLSLLPPPLAGVFPVSEERMTIGRGESCHLRVVHPLVSRQQCEVWAEEDRVLVRDLNSLNGTYVNGVRIRQRRLAFGDLLQVGPLVVQLIRALPEGEKVMEVGGDDEETDQRLVTPPTIPLPALSQVEQQIVRCLAEGQTEKEVASLLKLKPHVVHSHVKEVYRRLGITSRAQLVVWYWRGEVPHQPAAGPPGT